MNDQLLTQVNAKLDRLLAILDGPEEGENEALYLYCIKEFTKGNRKPLEAYGNRGGTIPKRFSLRKGVADPKQGRESRPSSLRRVGRPS